MRVRREVVLAVVGHSDVHHAQKGPFWGDQFLVEEAIDLGGRAIGRAHRERRAVALLRELALEVVARDKVRTL